MQHYLFSECKSSRILIKQHYFFVIGLAKRLKRLAISCLVCLHDESAIFPASGYATRSATRMAKHSCRLADHENIFEKGYTVNDVCTQIATNECSHVPIHIQE